MVFWKKRIGASPLKCFLRTRLGGSDCDPTSQEAEAGRLKVQGLPGKLIETLSQNAKRAEDEAKWLLTVLEALGSIHPKQRRKHLLRCLDHGRTSMQGYPGNCVAVEIV